MTSAADSGSSAVSTHETAIAKDIVLVIAFASVINMLHALWLWCWLFMLPTNLDGIFKLPEVQKMRHREYMISFLIKSTKENDERVGSTLSSIRGTSSTLPWTGSTNNGSGSVIVSGIITLCYASSRCRYLFQASILGRSRSVYDGIYESCSLQASSRRPKVHSSTSWLSLEQ